MINIAELLKEKELLFKDLCARLPYSVKVTFAGYSGRDDCILNSQHLNSTYAIEYLGLKPYLRPLSSMTEEEHEEYRKYVKEVNGFTYNINCSDLIDWFNRKMFDYRGLIPKGLANEAPEGMYNNSEPKSINNNITYKESEVICVGCSYRWFAERPVTKSLKDIECPWCGKQGFVIETGETNK